MDEIGEMKIKNEGDLRNAMQPVRGRSLPALTIPQTERWMQDIQVEGNMNYFPNSDATRMLMKYQQ